MLDPIDLFLKNKVLAAAFALLFGWIILLKLANADLRADLAEAQTKITTISTKNRELAEAIETQNFQIDTLHAEGFCRNSCGGSTLERWQSGRLHRS